MAYLEAVLQRISCVNTFQHPFGCLSWFDGTGRADNGGPFDMRCDITQTSLGSESQALGHNHPDEHLGIIEVWTSVTNLN